MPELTPQDINGVVLAFDFGWKTTGVAVGQTVTATAKPLDPLPDKDGGPHWALITALLEQWRPVALVVGLPLLMEGGEQDMTRAARRFGNRLNGRYHLPVFWQDERMTSMEADQLRSEQGVRAAQDSVAAALILESWFRQRQQQTTIGNEHEQP